MIVLDTNVVSEVMKEHPAPPVFVWFARIPRASLFTTTITQAEILAGIAILPHGKRRTSLLDQAMVTFEKSFEGRMMAFDSVAAVSYAAIIEQRRRAGAPISSLDAQIAAIASANHMAIATRNIRDFENCGVDLIDPWDA